MRGRRERSETRTGREREPAKRTRYYNTCIVVFHIGNREVKPVLRFSQNIYRAPGLAFCTRSYANTVIAISLRARRRFSPSYNVTPVALAYTLCGWVRCDIFVIVIVPLSMKCPPIIYPCFNNSRLYRNNNNHRARLLSYRRWRRGEEVKHVDIVMVFRSESECRRTTFDTIVHRTIERETCHDCLFVVRQSEILSK